MKYSPMVRRILDAADRSGLSDREVSKKAELNVTFVRDLRDGDSREPKRSSVEKLAKALQYHATWFLDGTGPKLLSETEEISAQIARESQALDPEDQEAVLDLVLRLKRLKNPAA